MYVQVCVLKYYRISAWFRNFLGRVFLRPYRYMRAYLAL
jgi:hypothetical protein